MNLQVMNYHARPVQPAARDVGSGNGMNPQEYPLEEKWYANSKKQADERKTPVNME